MLSNQLFSVEQQALKGHLTFYPSTGLKLHNYPIVLVHGWGVNSEIWQGLPQLLSDFADVYTLDLPGVAGTKPLDSYSEKSLVDWFHSEIPEPCYLIGLSLGGMLCRAFAAQFPEDVVGLVTLSTNLKFVADAEYSQAMPASDFESFSAMWDDSPEACLNRFFGLQAQGDQAQRQLIKQLRQLNSNIDIDAGKALLALLADLDATQQINQITCPSLSIFGGQDCLVPVIAAQQLPSKQETLIIEAASHLPHLSCQLEVVEAIRSFIDGPKYQLDKHQVAQSFGRAAATYDSAAQIQKWSGEQLIDGLNKHKSPQSILDLGCGTGWHSCLLKKQFPESLVTGVDFSSEMLEYANAHQAVSGINWLCSDAEDLALEDSSQELIFSNFALQWCNDPSPSLVEIFRLLKGEGEFHFAVPGPKTLWELREVWSTIDKDVHINRFTSMSQWQRALEEAGFSRVELKSTTKLENHASVKDLLMNLKTVGATNHNSGKTKYLTGKNHIKRLYDGYQTFQTAQGTYPVTWDIISGYAVK
jgi:malonyl-CoA O-methyltransferase